MRSPAKRAQRRSFCVGIDRLDLFDQWPGEAFADHARGNLELQSELRAIFRTRTLREWIAFAAAHDTTLAPFNTQTTLAEDPQFQHRMNFIPQTVLGCEQLPLPVFIDGEKLVSPSKTPLVGEHTYEVLSALDSSIADRS